MKALVSLAVIPLSLAIAFMACGHRKPKVVEPVVEVDSGAGDAEAADADAAPPAPPLYERLGGKDGVSAIFDSFLGNIGADKRVKKLFAKTTGPKLEHFKQMFVDQICSITGGGCTYGGKSMKDAHAGMGITEAQWNAVVDDLTLALEERQVSKDDQAELLGKLSAMKDDIVEKKEDKPSAKDKK